MQQSYLQSQYNWVVNQLVTFKGEWPSKLGTQIPIIQKIGAKTPNNDKIKRLWKFSTKFVKNNLTCPICVHHQVNAHSNMSVNCPSWQTLTIFFNDQNYLVNSIMCLKFFNRLIFLSLKWATTNFQSPTFGCHNGQLKIFWSPLGNFLGVAWNFFVVQ